MRGPPRWAGAHVRQVRGQGQHHGGIGPVGGVDHLLAAQAGAGSNAWGPYLSVLVSEQEDALSGVQGTFASIQPPDARADALRAELNDILEPAVDHVTDVRIAVRRGHLDDLDRRRQPLDDDQVQLRAFLDVHQ